MAMANSNPTPDERKAFRLLREKRVRISEQHKSLPKVYLDSNFWSYFSDIERGVAVENSKAVEIYDYLRGTVSHGKAICPVSDLVMMELLQKSDATDLDATLRVMDHLSGGVAFLESDQREELECAAWAANFFRKDFFFDPASTIFTIPFFIFGERIPKNLSIELYEALIAYADQVSFHDFSKSIPKGVDFSENQEKIYARISELNTDNTPSSMSFGSILNDEMIGVIDLLFDTVYKYAIDEFEKVNNMRAPEGFDESEDSKDAIVKAIYYSIKTNHPASSSLGSVLIRAHLHAQIRSYRAMPLSNNEMFDIEHAALAMVYCDAFLSDRGNVGRSALAKAEFPKTIKCSPASIKTGLAAIQSIIK